MTAEQTQFIVRMKEQLYSWGSLGMFDGDLDKLSEVGEEMYELYEEAEELFPNPAETK